MTCFRISPEEIQKAMQSNCLKSIVFPTISSAEVQHPVWSFHIGCWTFQIRCWILVGEIVENMMDFRQSDCNIFCIFSCRYQKQCIIIILITEENYNHLKLSSQNSSKNHKKHAIWWFLRWFSIIFDGSQTCSGNFDISLATNI